MRNKNDLMTKWIKQYFNLVYRYAFFVCNDRSLADKIVDRTFDRMQENIQVLKRKSPDEVKGWVLQTARYHILKEVYDSWERGEDLSQKYSSPDTLDPETIRKLMKQYEEMR